MFFMVIFLILDKRIKIGCIMLIPIPKRRNNNCIKRCHCIDCPDPFHACKPNKWQQRDRVNAKAWPKTESLLRSVNLLS